jgi:hypothetical protein
MIGGLNLSNNSIASSNGNFSVTSEGYLTASSGDIGPFSLGTGGLTSGSYITLSPSKLYVSSTPNVYENSFYAITNNGSYIGIRNN